MSAQRLQKLIAAAGISSRRHAEDLITAGNVTVNGKLITELGAKADPDRDHIKVKGKLINPQLQRHEKVYVLLNKPKGYLTSLSDPEDRPVVINLLPSSLGRLHPVGRLDFNTEGLLILTNDGELTNVITSAKNQVSKIYRVKIQGVPSDRAIDRLRRGVRIAEGERAAPVEIRKLRRSESNSWFEVVLHEGRNQQIRRMFDAIGHSVLKLRRVKIGFLADERLAPKQWRLLAPAEVDRLMGKRRKSRASAGAKAPRTSHGGRR